VWLNFRYIVDTRHCRHTVSVKYLHGKLVSSDCGVAETIVFASSKIFQHLIGFAIAFLTASRCYKAALTLAAGADCPLS
jgi:hypothetical protein